MSVADDPRWDEIIKLTHHLQQMDNEQHKSFSMFLTAFNRYRETPDNDNAQAVIDAWMVFHAIINNPANRGGE